MPPPKKADPPHKMVFTANSVKNTTVAVDSDALYYEVVTRFWHPNITKLNKLDPDSREFETIAEVQREKGQIIKIRLAGNDEWMPVSNVLKDDNTKIGGIFAGAGGTPYRWKTHRRRLQLVKADSDDKIPLAKYHNYRRHFFFFRMSKHAYLEIKPEIVEVLDMIILTYLIVERRRRDTIFRLNYP